MLKPDLKFDERGTFDKYLINITQVASRELSFSRKVGEEDFTPKESHHVCLCWIYRFPNNYGIEVEAEQWFKEREKEAISVCPFGINVLEFHENTGNDVNGCSQIDWDYDLTEKEVKALMRKLIKKKPGELLE